MMQMLAFNMSETFLSISWKVKITEAGLRAISLSDSIMHKAWIMMKKKIFRKFQNF